MTLIWLGNPNSFDHSLVGHKAATLSRLMHFGHCIPDGFCLPMPLLTLENLPDLRFDIDQALSALKACHNLKMFAAAVRSSAIEEDCAEASFAGQYETFLNVVGTAAIVEAIRRCWDSAHSERVQQYRHKKGLLGELKGMAVLVQQLVPADVSAIVFSVNPLTGNRNEIFINASWGLGQSIADGTITPDTFVIRKSNLSVIGRMIAVKHRMAVLIPGGTEEAIVPRFLQEQSSLSDEQIMEISHLVLTLEERMGYPVDIECVFANGQLYLLQCRPVTTAIS